MSLLLPAYFGLLAAYVPAGGGSPVAFSNLGVSAAPDINDATDLSSYASASWAPPSSGMINLFVYHRATTANVPTVSGNSLTWTEIATKRDTGGNWRITQFGADASGSTTGATTIAFGGQTQLFCRASFIHATNVDLSGGVLAAVVQVVTGEGSSVASGTINLAAAGAANNRPIAAFAHSSNEVTTHRTNWTEADDIAGGFVNAAIATQFRSDAFETTASASWATSGAVVWVGIAAELKAA